MKRAWIEGTRIRDISPGDPSTLYHPVIAALYDTDVPDDASNGDTFENGILIKRPSPVYDQQEAAEPVVEYPIVSPIEFKLLFTSAERIAIKSSTDPIVNDFFSIIEDPRLTRVDLGLQSTQNALLYLQSIDLITNERRLEILNGDVV